MTSQMTAAEQVTFDRDIRNHWSMYGPAALVRKLGRGWVTICLAGKAGFDLEARVGSPAAGALIYAKSRPGQPIPNFYDSNEQAMADIKRCAEADPLPEA